MNNSKKIVIALVILLIGSVASLAVYWISHKTEAQPKTSLSIVPNTTNRQSTQVYQPYVNNSQSIHPSFNEQSQKAQRVIDWMDHLRKIESNRIAILNKHSEQMRVLNETREQRVNDNMLKDPENTDTTDFDATMQLFRVMVSDYDALINNFQSYKVPADYPVCVELANNYSRLIENYKQVTIKMADAVQRRDMNAIKSCRDDKSAINQLVTTCNDLIQRISNTYNTPKFKVDLEPN